MHPLPPAILLMGPTASGKTDLAMALAERLPCELISVDSAMIYRGMDIGTAKPDPDTLARFPHRLIDILDPRDSYSAASFRSDALREMAEITGRGKIPLLVGGTMLYFRALTHGLAEMPSADPAVRARLDAEAERVGWEALHDRLMSIDPEAAGRIHPNDPQRLQRALEVYEITGRTLTELQRSGGKAHLPYRTLPIIVSIDRDLLHARIAARFRAMLEVGFLDEVERLYRRPDIGPDLPSIRCVGYRQAWGFLEGRYSREEMAELAITATRQLAKRQLTWLRKSEGRWFDGRDRDLLTGVLKYLEENSIK